MPRGSRGRGDNYSARRSAPLSRYDEFDDEWLSRIRERFDATYIDLQNWRHRRLWHPSRIWGPSYKTFGRNPLAARFLIVPEGHKLARHQTYGGRYTLKQVRSRALVRSQRRHFTWRRMLEGEWPYGNMAHSLVSRKIKFKPYEVLGRALPWQLVVCVRRQRRREVLHALNVAGKKGVGLGKPRVVNSTSNVRC